MIRKKFTDRKKHQNTIRWRGEEILRIEGFSDAVFAFAMTLLVVSLEVPKTFQEMKEGFHGMIGFAICFIMLFLIWQEQHLFFRKYYLKDIRTLILNAALLFVVLFYVYPLKFLFAFLTQGNKVVEHGHTYFRISSDQDIRELMIIYDLGYTFVYLVFLLMFINALTKREEIGLTSIEVFHTRTDIYKHAIFVAIGVMACVIAVTASPEWVGPSGMIYMLIGPSIGIYSGYRHKRYKTVFNSDEREEHRRWLEE